MTIAHVDDEEVGSSVRAKINAAIDVANASRALLVGTANLSTVPDGTFAVALNAGIPTLYVNASGVLYSVALTPV